MSKKVQKRLEREAKKQAEDRAPGKKVLMRFGASQFYNDQNIPIFNGGQIYVLEGASWIERWMKRGGEIVSEEIAMKDKGFDPKAPVSVQPGSALALEKAEAKLREEAGEEPKQVEEEIEEGEEDVPPLDDEPLEDSENTGDEDLE